MSKGKRPGWSSNDDAAAPMDRKSMFTLTSPKQEDNKTLGRGRHVWAGYIGKRLHFICGTRASVGKLIEMDQQQITIVMLPTRVEPFYSAAKANPGVLFKVKDLFAGTFFKVRHYEKNKTDGKKKTRRPRSRV